MADGAVLFLVSLADITEMEMNRLNTRINI
jgi:hypothetical protein